MESEGMKRKQIEFFFDLGSPYSYLASTQLESFERKNNVAFEWRPILLGGLFKTVDNQSPFYVVSKDKKNYLLNDLQAWASLYGVPYQLPSQFPPNTLKAMRGAIAARRAGQLKPYTKAMFQAFFVDDRNISDLDTILEIVNEIGMDVAEFSLAIDDVDVKQELISTTEEAADRGAFGVPTFFYQGQMFFGNDRLCLLEHSMD